MQCVRQDR